ncbi:hypothetical protein Tco_0934361 [Tanacetum coccineum]
MIIKSKILYDFPRFFGVLVAKLTASGMVNLTFKMNRDMIIENLYLEPKINAMVGDSLELVLETSPRFRERFTLMLLEHQDVISEFRSPSWWKELRKESGSKILPSGDGSCRKTFKPIASLIAKGKLK